MEMNHAFVDVQFGRRARSWSSIVDPDAPRSCKASLSLTMGGKPEIQSALHEIDESLI
jgi:hypothetical protein